MKYADEVDETPRRLEGPVLVDVHGTAWAAAVLDATLCHRGRVLVAEAPPPDASDPQNTALCQAYRPPAHMGRAAVAGVNRVSGTIC